MKEMILIFQIYLLKLINAEMDYICDNIYLGDRNAVGNEPYLLENDVKAVVNCAKGCISQYKEIRFLELNLYDNEKQNLFPKFDVAYAFIKENSNHNILIHCKEGKSRSVSLVVFYLMKEKGWDYDTCITFIRQKRPVAGPNSGFIKQLKEYYNKYINITHFPSQQDQNNNSSLS